jgi:hypothetical protein
LPFMMDARRIENMKLLDKLTTYCSPSLFFEALNGPFDMVCVIMLSCHLPSLA